MLPLPTQGQVGSQSWPQGCVLVTGHGLLKFVSVIKLRMPISRAGMWMWGHRNPLTTLWRGAMFEVIISRVSICAGYIVRFVILVYIIYIADRKES